MVTVQIKTIAWLPSSSGYFRGPAPFIKERKRDREIEKKKEKKRKVKKKNKNKNNKSERIIYVTAFNLFFSTILTTKKSLFFFLRA